MNTDLRRFKIWSPPVPNAIINDPVLQNSILTTQYLSKRNDTASKQLNTHTHEHPSSTKRIFFGSTPNRDVANMPSYMDFLSIMLFIMCVTLPKTDTISSKLAI